MTHDSPPVWRITGATVRGATHIRQKRPNQDALAWHAPKDPTSPRIIAVADGHGAPLHFRSRLGSRFAVRSTIELLKRYSTMPIGNAARPFHDLAVEKLRKELVDNWRSIVELDLRRRPFQEQELDALSRNGSPDARARLARDPIIAYGSTLMAAILLPDAMLFAQLGDGDITLIGGDGTSIASPLPIDPELRGNLTTSLGSQNAWRHLRTGIVDLEHEQPICILCSTDGYVNSFAELDGLVQAAKDLDGLARKQGLEWVTKSLPDWLRATSAQGSGDDITVALAVHM